MATLHCLPDRQDLPIESTETILEVLQNHDIPVQHVCNGNGECSTCRVVVESGLEKCTPRTRKEEALAKKLGFPPNIRLSCQTGTTGDVAIRRLIIDREDIAIADSQFETGIGEYRDQTVLVMTLRGGSDFDLSSFPYDALYVLNRFYRMVNRAITRYQGRLNSALGNKTVVLFDRLQDGRSHALRAALAIANDLQKLDTLLENLGYAPLQLTMGIHHGPLLQVPVGQDSALLGDALGLANRIDAFAAEQQTNLLISEAVYQPLASETVVARRLEMPLPKYGVLPLYEIAALNTPEPEPETPSLPQRMQNLWQRFRRWPTKRR